jgi:hypothetical protein
MAARGFKGFPCRGTGNHASNLPEKGTLNKKETPYGNIISWVKKECKGFGQH